MNRIWKDREDERSSMKGRLVAPNEDVRLEMRDIPGLGMVRVTVCPTAYAYGAGTIKYVKGHKGRRPTPRR